MSQQLSYIAAAVLHLRKDSSFSVVCAPSGVGTTAEIICCCVNVWSMFTGSMDTVSVQPHSDEV